MNTDYRERSSQPKLHVSLRRALATHTPNRAAVLGRPAPRPTPSRPPVDNDGAPQDEPHAGVRSSSRREFLGRVVGAAAGLTITLVQLRAEVALAKTNHFPRGYCTFWAAERFNAVAPEPGINWTGDAAQWFDNARTQSWPTSTDVRQAAAGAIVVWRGGGRGLGHVASIRAVTPTGIATDEMNVGRTIDAARAITTGFNRPTSATLSWAQVSRRGNLLFVGYIYPRPLAPSGLRVRTARLNLGRFAYLSWSLPTTSDRVLVERNALGKWFQIAELPAGTTSFTDNLTWQLPIQQYRVRVRNRYGLSAPSLSART